MDNRIDAITGGSRLTKRTVSALKVNLNFAVTNLKAVRQRNTKTKGIPARTLNAPTSSGSCRTSGWV